MPSTDRNRYTAVSRIMKALGEPIRLAIVDTLKGGERCVCDIAAAVGAERSNVSRHLSVLANAGILSSRKEGLQVFYTLRTPCILSIFSCCRNVLKAELDQARKELAAT